MNNDYQNRNIVQYQYTPYYTYPSPPIKPKKKMGRALFGVILVLVCMFASTVCGFIGSYYANTLFETNNTPTNREYLNAERSETVLFQSVLQTNDNEKKIEKMSIEDVVMNVKHSVVEIKTEIITTSRYMRQYVSKGAGSGVIISNDGYILTNNHVVEGAQNITVILSNEEEYEAKIVGTDTKNDLAVLKINAEDLQSAIMGYSSELLVGQTAIAIGNPLGELGGTVTTGIISALDREITIDGETMSLLQTDTAINPGNSGGGLFNLYGELIGIINAKSSGSEIEGLGFAIPIDSIKTVVEQIIKYGYVRGRVDTGFLLIDIEDALTAMSYRVPSLGLYIAESKNSDFKPGDRITAVGNDEITGLSSWNNEISKYSIGDTINISVSRNGKTYTYSLTLFEMTN